MSRLRQMSPWYWVMVGALVVAGLLLVSHFGFGWGPKWFPLVAMVLILASNIFTFRMLWKQSDHPAFHHDSQRPSAARESKSDR